MRTANVFGFLLVFLQLRSFSLGQGVQFPPPYIPHDSVRRSGGQFKKGLARNTLICKGQIFGFRRAVECPGYKIQM